MTVTTTQLRKNIYRLFDRAAATGLPIQVIRKGKTFTINPPAKKSWFDSLKKRPNVIKCDPEELVHIDWSKEWKPYI